MVVHLVEEHVDSNHLSLVDLLNGIYPPKMPIESDQSNLSVQSARSSRTTVVVRSDLGPFSIDLAAVDRAQQLVAASKKKPDDRSKFTVLVETFLGGQPLYSSRYWSTNLGRLLKLFSEEYFGRHDWTVVEEFHLRDERKVNPIHNVMKIPGEPNQRYLHQGVRFMKRSDGVKIVVSNSVDDDGDCPYFSISLGKKAKDTLYHPN